MSDSHLTDTRFDSFEFDSRVAAGIKDTGFDYCTPIQAETLPLALAGQDIAGQAQTGTGKTAAFLLATFQHLLTHPAKENRRKNQPRALMLAPTRELAVQIHKDALQLGAHTNFKIRAVFGGTAYEKQRKDLEDGVDILIGTPGRLIDYFKQKVFDLKATQVVVLDEADRMFDLGFIKDIRYLIRRTPPPAERLGLMFSATLSYRVTELAYEHMNNPTQIKVESDTLTADRIRQKGYMVANDEKIPLLIGLLRSFEEHRAIVFVNTKRAADIIWGFLEGNGFPASILSGDVPQKKRLALLKRFQDGELSVLVATDVVARGLHIEDVSHVINYDLPDDPEDYVHRIGRTARAGSDGDAISFVCESYAMALPDIETYIEQKLDVTMPPAELLAEVDPGSRVRTERRKPMHGSNRGGNRGGGRGRNSSGGGRGRGGQGRRRNNS
ncbi:RNA helicase [Solemya velum gill symbiont]|nr:RNA helicase [Solemya velum gill symbiont]